jgi:hypothetical protein
MASSSSSQILNTYTLYLNSVQATKKEGPNCLFKIPQQISLSTATSRFNAYVVNANMPNIGHNISSELGNNIVSFSLQANVIQTPNAVNIPLGWNNVSSFYVPGGTRYYGNSDFSFTIDNGIYNTQDLLTIFTTNLSAKINLMNSQANANYWASQWAFNYLLNYVDSKNQTEWNLQTKNSWLVGLDNGDTVWMDRYRLYIYPSEIAFMLGWNDSGVTQMIGPPLQVGDPYNILLNFETVFSPSNVDSLPNFITYITTTSLTQTNSYNSVPSTNEIDMVPSNILCSVPVTNNPYTNQSSVQYTYTEFNYPIKIPITNRNINEILFELKDYRLRSCAFYNLPWSITLVFEEVSLPEITKSLNVNQLNDLENQWLQQQQLETELQMQILKNKIHK